MAEKPSWPLGQNILISSTAHQTEAYVTVTMDNRTYKQREPDYDWAGGYGVHELNSAHPSPAPYPEHKGTDIAKGKGSPIYAISGGIVKRSGGTFNDIYIELIDDTTDVYLHCDIAAGISVGKNIAAGDLIGYENGWGATGPATYGSHLHLDKYITSVGRGPGTIDTFNYAQGQGIANERSVYVKVEDINNWDSNSDKIGLWVGNVVKIKKESPLYYDVNGTRANMTLNKSAKPLYAWKGEFGSNMQTIVSNLVKDMAQISVYDNFGAFHPKIWIKISDIEW